MRITKGKPQAIDRHIGHQLRRCRLKNGYSQAQTAKAIGVTFQQIQKYEKGTNRIGGSRLWMLACFLRVKPGFFFEGLTDTNNAMERNQQP